MIKASSYAGAAVFAGCLIVIATSLLCLVPLMPRRRWSTLSSSTSPGRLDHCRSRGEFGRYVAALSFGPSTALEKALADYEYLHAQCLLSDLAIVAGSDPLQNYTSCKYLLYLEDRAGLGNHIMSLVSAFLYALLTDRVLLLDTRGHLPNLLCEPFASSSWLAPPAFPYSHLLAAAAHNLLNSSAQDVDPAGRILAYHAHLDYDQSPLEQKFWDPASQERLLSIPWLAWSSNQYLVPRFFTLPSLWPRLLTLFPSHPYLTFSHLARYLLLPANKPWELAVHAHQTHLSASNFTVGLQVRPHFVKPKDSFSRPAFDRIMQCLTTHLGVGTTPSKEQRPRTAIMVVSLQGLYYEEIKRAFMVHPSSPQVSVHTLSTEYKEQHTWDQHLKAFVEMWVLSMCDELATSSWSTFGYVARGLRGKPSWLLHIRADLMDSHQSAHLKACSLQRSPDPCNHFPFLTHNKALATSNQSLLNTSLSMIKWDDEHLFPCIDMKWGIQLIDHENHDR